MVEQEDLNEAMRLITVSRSSLTDYDQQPGRGGWKKDVKSQIFNIIKQAASLAGVNKSLFFNIFYDFYVLFFYDQSCVFTILLVLFGQSNEVEDAVVEGMVLKKGFTRGQLDGTIDEYDLLEVVKRSEDRSTIILL